VNIDDAKNSLKNYQSKSWRPFQRETCEKILNSKKKFINEFSRLSASSMIYKLAPENCPT